MSGSKRTRRMRFGCRWARLSGVVEPRPDADAGGRVFDVTDPDGHVVQFVQRDPGGPDGSAAPDRRISRRILHIGLTVKDPAAADRFYKDALRLLGDMARRTARRHDQLDQHARARRHRLPRIHALPDAPPEPASARIGAPRRAARPPTSSRRSKPSARARSPAIRNHRATPNIGVNNRWQLNVFDPDGTRVEFMEPWTVR